LRVPSLRGALATKQSSLDFGLLVGSLRSSFSHRKIRAKEVHKRNHNGHGEQYVALIQNHASIFPKEDGRRERVKIQASYASRFSRHNELDA
jgi:hypothetical protein